MSKLKWLKGFAIFYGITASMVTIDKWLFGWIVQFSAEKQPLAISYETFIQIGMGQRLLGLLNESILTGLFLIVLYHLYIILQMIEIKQVFSQNMMSNLGKIAKFYLGYTILFPITMAIQSVIVTFHNTPKTLTVSLMGANFDQVLLAGCLYVIFYVMQEAYHVANEHKMVI